MIEERRAFRLAELAEQGALALRRQVHDLFALLDLPAHWQGREPREIAESFMEVIVQLLRLDVALIHLREPNGVIQQSFPSDLASEALLEAVQEAGGISPTPFELPRPNTVGRRAVRVVSVSLLGEQGVVLAGSWRQNFPTAHELQLLQTAATQATLAMQSSREARAQRNLAEAEQRARREAEERQQRADLLAEASAILGSSHEFAGALTRIAHLVVPRFADWVTLQVSERVSSSLEETQTVVVHRDASQAALAREYSRSLLSTGGELRPCITNNSALAPIRARGRSFGAIIFGAEEPGRYGTETLVLVEELGLRAGVALENAQLFVAAQEADRRKDEFLAMLGHELRNPLSPILTALQLMRLKAPSSCERERTIIERQIEHMVRLVEDLLDVSRITRGKIQLKREQLDLMTVLTKALEMTGPLLEQRSHHVQFDPPPEPLLVEGDGARLAQVMANLLNNAAKYTDPGGRIHLSASREGGQGVLRVRDSGTGISPEILPKIFELFVQDGRAIDRSQGGLGLGLSIVRSLVELHGGTVSAHSEGIGRGSEFVVRLPLAKALAPRDGEVPAPGQAGSWDESALQPLRILVVDDNRDAAEMLSEALGRAGFITRTAFDGPTGFEAATDFCPAVALLDIGLPVMDGYELAGRLRTEARLHDLKLIALTGYGQESDRRRALESSFDLHLVKPVDFAQLLGAIRGLLRGTDSGDSAPQEH